MASPYDLLRAASAANRAARATTPLAAPEQAYTPAAPLDPYEALRRATNENRGAALGITTVETPIGPRFLQDIPKPIRDGVGGALRGVARALEPLQLPQDAMFAVVAGAFDRNTTIAQRLSTMRLASYLPGGVAPERPASGEEIFHLLGFDEGVARWAGIGADLIVDPLIFGSFLRVAGKVSKANELVALGNKFDHFISPLGVATEVNNLARRSKTISDFQDARMMRLFEALRNPNSSMFGIQNFGTKAARVADMVLPQDMALRLRLGPEVGQQVFDAQQKAASVGRRVSDTAYQSLKNALHGADGDQSKKLVEMFTRDMGEQAAAFEARLSALPSTVREVIEAETYRLANQQVNAGFMALAAPDKLRDPALKGLSEDIFAAIGRYGPEELGDKWGDVFASALRDNMEGPASEARRRIAEVAGKQARRAGMASEDVERSQRLATTAFDNYLRDTVTIDARLGLHTSGYTFVADGVRNRVFELTGNVDAANDEWMRILRVGLTGGRKALDELRSLETSIRIDTPSALSSADTMRRMANRNSRMAAVNARLADLEEVKAADAAARAAPGAARDAALAGAQARRDAVVPGLTAELEAQKVANAAIRERLAGVSERSKAAFESDVATMRTDLNERLVRQRDTLLGGLSELPQETVAYVRDARDFLVRYLPSAMGQARETSGVLRSLDRLTRAGGKHDAALRALLAADVPSPKLMNDLIKAERGVELEFGRQADWFTRLGVRMVDMGLDLTPSSLKTTDGILLFQDASGSYQRSFGMLSRRHVTIGEGMEDAAAVNEQAVGRMARQRADEVAQERQASSEFEADAASRAAEVRSQRAAAEAEFKNSRTAANQAYREERSAVMNEQATRRAVEAAEREAEGLPRPGTARDLYNVAANAPYTPRSLRTRAMAVALEGNNTTIDDILHARYANMMQETAGIKSRNVDAATLEALTAKNVTYGELLDGISGMQALDLGDFLEGLMNGHLRKAYGLFLDQGDFNQYLDRLRDGSVIITNRVIDEADLARSLPDFATEARLISEYHNTLKAAGGGNILRRDGIVDYLAAAGVDARRINGVLEALQRSLSDSPAHQRNIDILKEWRARYISALEDNVNRPMDFGGAIPLRNQHVFKERVELTNEMVSILGEHARASMSLLEGTMYAQRTVRRQEFFQQVYKAAQQNGYIKNAAFMDEFGVDYVKLGDGVGAMAGFSGRYVHPFLLKELEKAAVVKEDFIPAAFNRVRSLITGGYLAAPSVLAANFFGGIYQAATFGINPAVLLRRMGEVLPDMLAAARGEETQLIRALRRHGDLEMTGLVSADYMKDFQRLVRADAGFGPQGAGAMFDKVTTWYEDFLQRPGIGRFRVKFAGLEGFQFTENWFKVASFKEMTERLARDGMPSAARAGGRVAPSAAQAEKIAAEFARQVVFDYSALPQSLDFLKKTGVLMFPGFAYFMAGRTLSTALRRPGVLAVSDRISEALMNASLPVDEQVLAYLGMSPWMREDQGAPLPFSARLGRGDNKQVSMIPVAQLVPTQTIWDGLFGGGLGANPWAESISQLGIWGPLIDVISALTNGSGEAPITGQYGHVVFEPGAEGAEKAGEVFRFLYNTMAPSVVRKGLSRGYDGQWKGLAPAVGNAFAELGDKVPEDFLAGVYSINERRTGRPEQAPSDQIVAAFLRSPQVVALEGPLAGVKNTLGSERTALNAQLAALTARHDRAVASGDVSAAGELLERMRAARDKFDDQWREYSQFARAYNARRSAQREGVE